MTETLIPDVGLLEIGVDITQVKNMTTALKQECRNALMNAGTDLLTGMGNRRALERLRKMLGFVRNVGSRITFDAGHFSALVEYPDVECLFTDGHLHHAAPAQVRPLTMLRPSAMAARVKTSITRA